MGFIHGQNGVTVTVNNPPSQGNYTANNGAWEIVIQQTMPMWFARLFLSSAPVVSSRAVAGSSSTCHSDPGGDDTGGASGTNFVLSNNETVVLPDMNGKTMNVSGWGTVQFSHDANGATLIIDSSCINTNSLAHDFNGSTFIDNYTPPNMNFVYVAHTLNGATFTNGSAGSGGVFTIGHDSNGASFTFITCASCSADGSGKLAVVE